MGEVMDVRIAPSPMHLGVLKDELRYFFAVRGRLPLEVVMTPTQAMEFRDCLADGHRLGLTELEYEGTPVVLAS